VELYNGADDIYMCSESPTLQLTLKEV